MDPEPGLEPGPESDPKSNSELDTEPDPESNFKSNLEPGPESGPEPGLESDPKSNTEPDPEPDPESDPESDPRSGNDWTFLKDVPPELRNTIYKYSFPYQARINVDPNDRIATLQGIGMHRANRQLCDETEAFLYNSRLNHVHLVNSECVANFEAWLTDPRLGDVSKLEVFHVDAHIGYMFNPLFVMFHRVSFTFDRPRFHRRRNKVYPEIGTGLFADRKLYVHKSTIVNFANTAGNTHSPPTMLRNTIEARNWTQNVFSANDLRFIVRTVAEYADFERTNIWDSQLKRYWRQLDRAKRRANNPNMNFCKVVRR